MALTLTLLQLCYDFECSSGLLFHGQNEKLGSQEIESIDIGINHSFPEETHFCTENIGTNTYNE